MSEWGSHNNYSKMAITNNFVALKHSHIVATELSRAQLCFPHRDVCTLYTVQYRTYIQTFFETTVYGALETLVKLSFHEQLQKMIKMFIFL